MGPLSFFVPVALIASLTVALIFIPFISSLLGQQKQKEGDVFKKLSDRYATTLSQLLSSKKRRNTFLKVVGGLLFVAVLIPMVQLVHFRMLPTADKNQFYVYIDAPEDTVSVQTAEVAETLGNILLASDAVDSIQYYIAEAPVVDFNGLFRNSTHRTGEHQATLRVNLIDKNDRRETSSEIVDTLREQSTSSTVLQRALQQGVTLQFIQDPPGPPVQATFVAKVSGSDQGMREALSEYIYSSIQTIDGVVDVKQSQEFTQMEMAYTIDHQKLTELGVSVHEVMQTLEAQFSETIVDRYRSTDGEGISYILMESAQRYQDQGTDSAAVYVETANGVVPLGSLVRPVEREKEPMSVRDNGVETLFVTAETQGRSIVYVMLDVMSMLRKDPTYNVERWSLTGMTVSQGEEVMEIQWGGEWKMTLENFRDLGLAMMVAMVMIFLLLVAQFKQFLTPALIMVTIPLGLIGIMFGFVLLDLGGIFLTATSLIGFIALMGIVVNNAILYLEQFNLEREAGAEIREALIESGRIRLRPILLTSLTTILGSLTIISDPVWSGLAWSIIFGLSLSSLLTLGVFPVLMYTFNNKA
jgi:multidrug efflux pump subunit AcrB